MRSVLFGLACVFGLAGTITPASAERDRAPCWLMPGNYKSTLRQYQTYTNFIPPVSEEGFRDWAAKMKALSKAVRPDNKESQENYHQMFKGGQNLKFFLKSYTNDFAEIMNEFKDDKKLSRERINDLFELYVLMQGSESVLDAIIEIGGADVEFYRTARRGMGGAASMLLTDLRCEVYVRIPE